MLSFQIYDEVLVPVQFSLENLKNFIMKKCGTAKKLDVVE